MTSREVVILSGRSLFAEGVASSLRRRTDSLQITVIDPREPQVLEQIADVAPAIVIIDSRDATLMKNCWVTSLLSSIPAPRIIRLDPRSEQIQIVIGEYRKATHIDELIELIGAECDKAQGG
jgi:hypothetical protein